MLNLNKILMAKRIHDSCVQVSWNWMKKKRRCQTRLGFESDQASLWEDSEYKAWSFYVSWINQYLCTLVKSYQSQN